MKLALLTQDEAERVREVTLGNDGETVVATMACQLPGCAMGAHDILRRVPEPWARLIRLSA